MKIKLEFQIIVECPIDGARILLAVTVKPGDQRLHVEDLLRGAYSTASAPMLQEDFTRRLAGELRMPVKTVGVHSGVTITCRA